MYVSLYRRDENMEKKTFVEKLKGMGPAAIITSAFIGPGTITTATIAGAEFKYALLWAVLFSVVTLMVLMEMASRIGIIADKDIVEASVDLLPNNKVWGYFIKTLMVVAGLAVAFGFQAGNIIGSSIGLSDIAGVSQVVSALIVGGLSLSTILFGTADVLEKIMLVFVSAMGVIFIVTMFAAGPNYLEVLKGLVSPTIPTGGLVSTVALIGTTLIAINIVMHSITSKDKWNKVEDMEDAKFDIVVNVLIGGFITVAMVVTSGTVLYGVGVVVDSPLVFSTQLIPILGKSGARIIGGLGIFAAGLSSSIATAFIICTIISRIFHWEGGIDNYKTKAVGSIVIIFGMVLAMLNVRPVQIITAAQVISGFFLPFVSILIVLVTNSKRMIGKHTNTLVQNIFGVLASIITLILGVQGIYDVILGFLA